MDEGGLKEMRKNLVRILVAVLPFVLGFAITCALGVSRVGSFGEPLNGNGFPFAWLYDETPLANLPGPGVDFVGFFADFLFWSGIFAAAFWFAYYVYS